MPIIVKNFEWTQSESKINLYVPMKGVLQAKTDVFCSTRYIKVSYEQYFFEAVLIDTIDVNQSKCVFVLDAITFELTKCENKLWSTLEVILSKSEKLQLKLQLIEEAHKQLQEKIEANRTKKHELKQLGVRLQISNDTKMRNKIECIKKEEETKALGDLKHWKEELIKPSKPHIKKLEPSKLQIKKLEPKKTKLTTPKIRSNSSLQVLFTPREFRTPKRESKEDEENEWLKKQAAARRSAGFISEDIRPEERNPQFLKAKGDEFMKNQNYLGAISAYSFGIKLSDKLAELYVARSEAQLAVGNHHKVITDCSTALDLMKPAVEANRMDRALCVGRRGVALWKVGMLKQAVGELEATLRLNRDEYFEGVLKEVRQDLEKERESTAQENK